MRTIMIHNMIPIIEAYHIVNNMVRIIKAYHIIVRINVVFVIEVHYIVHNLCIF